MMPSSPGMRVRLLLSAAAFAGLTVMTTVSATPPDDRAEMPVTSASMAAVESSSVPAAAADPVTRNGLDIYHQFRSGLANPNCAAGSTSARWSRHFDAAPKRLARRDKTLALFGYVVDALRKAGLPTEYALIPFVETGYKPGARSPLGAAGLWQMIEVTARDHDVSIRAGYDGRLSPVESTRAAVRYLQTLHGLFGGNWRLAVMGYNAGQFRILQAIEQAGLTTRDADPAKLSGLPTITRAYVRKLRALTCLMLQTGKSADEREAWLAQMDRPVARLQAVMLPTRFDRIAPWATDHGLNAQRLRWLNPVYVDGRIRHHGDDPVVLLAPALRPAAETPGPARTRMATMTDSDDPPRTHTVVRGDTLSALAQEYGVPLNALMGRNALTTDSVIKPGMVLQVDAAAP